MHFSPSMADFVFDFSPFLTEGLFYLNNLNFVTNKKSYIFEKSKHKKNAKF